MRKNYEKKIIDCKALDVDTVKRQVKFAMAKVEDLDRDKEIFFENAFDKTIKENGPVGTNEVWHLLDHGGGMFSSSSFSALSKVKELGKDGQHIYGVSQYKDSFAWREVAWPLYESGDFTQHSVGFTVTKDTKNEEGFRVIKEVRLWEGSAVLWGANPNTPVMQLIKSEFDEELEPDELIYARFERAIKRIKEDKFSDNNKSLLLIELLRLQNNFVSHSEKTTKPESIKEQQSTLPEDVVETIKQYRSQLNRKQYGQERTLAGT